MTITKDQVISLMYALHQSHAGEENDSEIDWDMSIMDFMDWLESANFVTIKFEDN